MGPTSPQNPARCKGLCGVLAERALGATAGPAAHPDFPELGVELKTIPVGPGLRPRESTYVCAINLATIAGESWPTSRVRRKLHRVLFLPVQSAAYGPLQGRRFLAPRLWQLGGPEEDLLRADWEELVSRIGTAGMDGLSARHGRCLQVRPKARSGRARVLSSLGDGRDGGVFTCPRGFYLRASFTFSLLTAPVSGAVASP